MTIQRLSGGKQTDWQSIRAQTDQPIITIITSTYNVAKDLHWTIDSIKAQSYPHIQWIVADGASNDGTVEILQEHNELIDYWFSEPDTGIYDAWNKALEHVQGDWVQFIGAGDELYEPDTLTKVVKHLKDAHPKYDLVYGQVMHISEKGRKKISISGQPWESYVGEWSTYGRPEIPMHPGIYHKKSLFIGNIFDCSLRISADSLFILESLERNNNMLYIEMIVDKFVAGGISDSFESFLIIYQEMRYIKNKLGFNPPFHIQFIGRFKYIFKKNMIKYIGLSNSTNIMHQFKSLNKKIKVRNK